jgi:hypothetical protein
VGSTQFERTDGLIAQDNCMEKQRRGNPKVPKFFLTVLIQLWDIERKVRELENNKRILRGINRIKEAFRSGEIDPYDQDIELFYEDPQGETCDDTRSDLEVNITGESTDNLVVVDVIKPIIRVRYKRTERTEIVQKGIVTVQSVNTEDRLKETLVLQQEEGHSMLSLSSDDSGTTPVAEDPLAACSDLETNRDKLKLAEANRLAIDQEIEKLCREITMQEEAFANAQQQATHQAKDIQASSSGNIDDEPRANIASVQSDKEDTRDE